MNRSSKGGNSIEEEVVILKERERERENDTNEKQRKKRINVVTI